MSRQPNSFSKKEILVTFTIFLLLLFGLAGRFLNYIEERKGVVIDDPILKLFQPIDLTWLSFVIIYGGVLISFWQLLKHKRELILGLQAYTLLLGLRILSMFLLPLEAPVTMLAMPDPLVEFFGGSNKTLTKDLFFSGHTSTMFLLYLTMPNKKIKPYFLVLSLLLPLCLVAQHVHYSVDVFLAPFAAWGSYSLILKWHSLRKQKVILN